MPSSLSFGAIILAAGRSRRMGRPKMLLPWGKTSVLGHLLAQWLRLGSEQIAVVCATGDRGLAAELDRLDFPADQLIANPSPGRGMFSSIQCAARWPGWKPSVTHWAIALGDQPQLHFETLEATLALAAAKPDKVCQPSRGGRRRHPVILPKAVWALLVEATAPTLKEFLESLDCQVASFESNDPGLDLDLDTPEDYEKALGAKM